MEDVVLDMIHVVIDILHVDEDVFPCNDIVLDIVLGCEDPESMSYDVSYDMRAGRYDPGFMSYDVVNDILHVDNDFVNPRNDIVNDIGTGRYDLQSMSYDVVNDMAMSITTSSGVRSISLRTCDMSIRMSCRVETTSSTT